MNFTQQKYNRLNNKMVWISDKVQGQLIRFIIEEEPRIRLIADIASGASIFVYDNEFETVFGAFNFAEEEFEKFVKGESLSVGDSKLGGLSIVK